MKRHISTRLSKRNITDGLIRSLGFVVLNSNIYIERSKHNRGNECFDYFCVGGVTVLGNSRVYERE